MYYIISTACPSLAKAWDLFYSQSLGRFKLSINLISDTIDDSSLGIGNLVIPFRKRIGAMPTFWKGNYCIILYLTDELVAPVADYTLGIV